VPASGFFGTTAEDLHEKLRRDLSRLEANPTDTSAAFDFFVTARALVDHLYPGCARGRLGRRRQQVLSRPEIRVGAALANGAKHLVLDDRGANASVRKTEVARGGFFASRYFGVPYFGPYFGRPTLMVRLEPGDPSASTLGESATALDLARRIAAYWDTSCDLRTTGRGGRRGQGS
jgi:hypothetical protein